jgi:hypothetical protein
MNQQPLFELEQAAVQAVAEACRECETDLDRLSQMGDKRRVRRLCALANKLERTTDPIERAKLATEARDLAEALVEETILDANRAGITWRELGAGLGVPFQTLYRRYGANR